jgi:hypothetical protein
MKFGAFILALLFSSPCWAGTPTLLCSNTAGPGTSVTCTASISNSGDLLIITGLANTSEALTVSDTKGNTWQTNSTTPIVSTQQNSGFQNQQTWYVSANNGSGSDTFQIAGSSDNIAIDVTEWSAQSATLDGFAGASNGASSTSLDSGASSGSGSNSNDLVYAACAVGSNTLSTAGSFNSLHNYSFAGAHFLIEYYTAGAGNAHGLCTQSGSATWSAQVLTFTPSGGGGPATYYMSTSGNDANNGTSVGTPWLTPNHSVNCGDIIIAAAGAYTEANLTYNKWGVATCAAGNNVAWVKCVTFDACTVNSNGGQGIDIDESYWGIQGFEDDGNSAGVTCFSAYAGHGAGTGTIHHIIFANDIAQGCGQGGFTAGPNGIYGVDYFVVIGSIAYGTDGSGTNCNSAINVYEPVASDTLPGTHYYLAGDFAWDNVDGNPCNGGGPTDGEGMFFDSVDGSQTGLSAYTPQMVMDNSITFLNGGRGAMVFQNIVGGPNAHIFFRHITAWGNNKDTNQNATNCGEIETVTAFNTQVTQSIGVTNASTGCGANTIYGLSVIIQKTGDVDTNDYAYSASGNYTTDGGQGFTFGPNIFTTNPVLSNPGDPGAPSCSSASSVPNCMATVIANFAPTAQAAKAYGYQAVVTACASDPLYPQWLNTVTNLPTGLVTPGCKLDTTVPPGVVITPGVVIADKRWVPGARFAFQ